MGYWSFDEGSGQSAADLSGNDNDGTLHENPKWKDGQIGDGALEFDGKKKFVSVSEPSLGASTLDISNKLTICTWVKIKKEKKSEWQAVVAKGDESSGPDYKVNYLLIFYTDGDDNYDLWFKYDIGDGQLRSIYWQGRNFSSSDGWMHLAVTVDAAQQEVKFYYNGNLDHTDSLPHTSLPISKNGGFSIGARPLVSGGGSDGHTEHFKGQMDEVYVYSRVLTQSEINSLKDSGLTSGGSDTNTVRPDADRHKLYQQLHQQYQRLYPALRDEFRNLGELSAQ